MIRLTTARFSAWSSIDRRIADRLALRDAMGWWVRTAGPRNYLAWRNSRALSAALPVIILPNDDFPFTWAERNVAVLREILRAEIRVMDLDANEREDMHKRFILRLSGLQDNEGNTLAARFAQIERKIVQAMVGAARSG
ncbi:MAG: hypothetical protein KF858_16885 [Candidatus Sumerlaeia bacterium]|nr:hypothetical protein [Candidatus Sumerlaeia bacterium]